MRCRLQIALACEVKGDPPPPPPAQALRWLCTGTYAPGHVAAFQTWALRVGLILEEVTLPYIQLAAVTVKKPSFLQGPLRTYSQVKGGGGGAPPPPPHLLPSMGIGIQYFFEETRVLRMSHRSWFVAGC